jgi:anti-sigma factor RsiW
MPCDLERAKLDAYLDGELTLAETSQVATHLRTCPACAADAVERTQLKRAVAIAGQRYAPSAGFRERIAQKSTAKPRRQANWYWKLVAAPAIVVLLISLATSLYVRRETTRRQRVYSELIDLHVAALAASTPVDVVSSDRHTVKPWFQGKIPFTFNLPELQGTDFALLGGRVSYLAQTPGAQLIYQVRKHEISVFIFQDRAGETSALPSEVTNALSFNVENWTQNGLHYFVVGDVNGDDIRALSKLLRGAG